MLDGLLFWATTTAAYARDPIPHTHSLTIQNLVMEIFCKMCAHSENINLLLATPPMDRIVQLFQKLSKLLTETDQVGFLGILWHPFFRYQPTPTTFAVSFDQCLLDVQLLLALGIKLYIFCWSNFVFEREMYLGYALLTSEDVYICCAKALWCAVN